MSITRWRACQYLAHKCRIAHTTQLYSASNNTPFSPSHILCACTYDSSRRNFHLYSHSSVDSDDGGSIFRRTQSIFNIKYYNNSSQSGDALLRNGQTIRAISFRTTLDSSSRDSSSKLSLKKISRGLLSAALFCFGILIGGGIKLAYNTETFEKRREDDLILHYLTSDAMIDGSPESGNALLLNFPSVSAAKGFSETNTEDKLNNNDSSNNSYFNNEKKGSGKDPPKHRATMNFIADVVERVAPSVVFIETVHPHRYDMGGQPLRVNHGSGFVVGADGLILTNAHVVTNGPKASRVMVRFQDGRELIGLVELVDPLSDLALLRVDASGLPTAILGSSASLRPGEFVVAVGSPLSLSNSVSAGVVSSTKRYAKDLGISANDITYIQTDAAITFGNSGGPLANLDGEVIGINSMKAAEGISFAIPVDIAKEFMAKAAARRTHQKQVPATSTSIRRRGYLGITMLTLTPDIISELQTKLSSPLPPDLTQGVMVWRVAVGSPAYHAGLQPGDVVTHINGHEIRAAGDVYRMLEKPSDLTMVVHRGNNRYTVKVTPEE
uniref:Serine protease HTRA2, mitochondrial n=1 Tax=Hirondellea gigas TaxID=1518452 RepID=A0A6A7G1X7_9CRUS